MKRIIHSTLAALSMVFPVQGQAFPTLFPSVPVGFQELKITSDPLHELLPEFRQGQVIRGFLAHEHLAPEAPLQLLKQDSFQACEKIALQMFRDAFHSLKKQNLFSDVEPVLYLRFSDFRKMTILGRMAPALQNWVSPPFEISYIRDHERGGVEQYLLGIEVYGNGRCLVPAKGTIASQLRDYADTLRFPLVPRAR